MSEGPPLSADLWGRLPAEAQALILALRAEVAELRAKVKEQQQHITQLQERLNQNSTNSSRPPSADPPTVKRRPPRTSLGRCRGGQPGHERQQRPLLPPDHTEVLNPSRSPGAAPPPPTRPPGGPEPPAVPPLRARASGPRPAAATPPGAGAAQDPARGHGVPAAPPALPGLWTGNVRLLARRRAQRRPGASFA